MNRETLTLLAKQAALHGQMVADYPDPTNKKVTFPPSPYYRFLNLLAKHMGAELSVELGVCGGGGSLHLAMAGGQVVGVDVTNDYPDNMEWMRRHYPNFHFLRGDSVQNAVHIYEMYGFIDILFIDTTHTYEQTMMEYGVYAPFLSREAVVCLDDLYREGMDRAWDAMPDTKARFDFLHPQQSPTDGGFGVVWR